MSKLWAVVKSAFGLLYQGLALIIYYLGIILKKFWKVIVVIFTALISLITLKAFKKKGGKIECEEN